jgi:hypothetical protein
MRNTIKMKSDNPPGLNASHPDTEADEADLFIDIWASKSKTESSNAEKATAGVAVGNKKDAEVDLAFQSKRDRKAEKKNQSACSCYCN